MFTKGRIDSNTVFSTWYVRLFAALLFISLSLYISYDIRDGQVSLDGLRPLVEQSILSQIQGNIVAQIDAQFPIATADFKAKLVEKTYNEILTTGVVNFGDQKIVISDIVDGQVASIKQNFQTADGQTYLGSIDPYYYLALADNYLNYNQTGDSIDANGNPVVSKMLAPTGAPGTFRPEFNVWIIAKLFTWNKVTLDSPVSEIFKTVFLLPVWLSLLAVIPCYLIVRRFSNDIFAFFGTLVCMSVGIFVSRTLAGAPDNDPYYVIFPLIIAAFFIYAISEKKLWLALVLAGLAGFSQGVITIALANAWFILFFIIISSIMYMVYLGVEAALAKRHSSVKEALLGLKKEVLILVIYLVFGFISGLAIVHVNIFTSMVQAISINVQSIATFYKSFIWPNVLSSVAELNPASFSQIISSVGGNAIFLLAFVGLLFMTLDFEWKHKSGSYLKWILAFVGVIWFSLFIYGNIFISLTSNSKLLFLVLFFLPIGIGLILSVLNQNIHPRLAALMLLSVWIASTIYMSFNGVRFIMLLGPAFAIAFGISLFYIFKSLNMFCTEYLGNTGAIVKYLPGLVLTCIIFFSLYSPMYTSAQAMSNQPAILFDRAWFDAMDTLKANSSPDAIVTSWWDFGHFFHAIGRRAVTFDGASQSTPQSHWVGRFLMENNETVARDILKMLVCGGNEAFNTMYAMSKDATGGILVNKVIYSTFGQSDSVKRQTLQNNQYLNFTSEQTDEIMKLLSCSNPRESIVVTSGDMVGKASVWAHWGSWDFTKKYVFDNYRSQSIAQMASAIREEPALISRYVAELNKIAAVSKSQNQNYNSLINQWFAPYPGYYPAQNGGYFVSCTQTNSTISCENSVKVSLNASSLSVTSGLQIPIGRAVFISSDTNKIKTYDLSDKFPVGTVYVDAVFAQTGENAYNLMLAQSPLGGSLFTRLFFLNGQSTKYFEPIGSFNSQTQGKISMWKTNWTKN